MAGYGKEIFQRVIEVSESITDYISFVNASQYNSCKTDSNTNFVVGKTWVV